MDAPQTAQASKGEVVAADNSIIVNDGNGGVRSAKESIGAFVQPKSLAVKSKSFNPQNRTSKPVPTSIDLGDVSQQKSTDMRKQQIGRPMGKAMQVGFPRDVIQAKDSAATGQLLQWSATADGGQITALSFRSGAAEGIRIGVAVQSLPPDATIRFYASGSTAAVEVTGKTINDSLAQNLAAGDSSEDGRTYWGPFLKGQTGILEIELPKDVAASTVVIAVPKISHFFLDPLGKESISEATGGGGSFSPKAAGICNRDATCNEPLSTASKSVALMVYVEGGNSSICTGTLLNNTQKDGIPYFLSADHCISTQTVASTLETRWFWRSSGCDSGVLNPYWERRTGGATLLYNRSVLSGAPETGRGTDTSFMQLRELPPASAVYSGWSAATQLVSNADYTGVHNPHGDPQKYSIGRITGFAYFDSAGSGFINNFNSSLALYKVNWLAGVTESGSSGSGLFLNAESVDPKLVGQLWGGSSSCDNQTASDVYGRFDIAFQESLATWLSPYSQDVIRFYNSASGSYFYSISNAEVQSIRQSYPSFRLQGAAYAASPVFEASLASVYRFRNKVNGSYLWTISQEERASINKDYSATFVEEGTAWFARQTPATGFSPLYRFRNITNGTYFYTASEDEKNNVVLNFKQTFVLEGVAYFVKA